MSRKNNQADCESEEEILEEVKPKRKYTKKPKVLVEKIATEAELRAEIARLKAKAGEVEEKPATPPKPKRVLSEKQLAGLEAGRVKRVEKLKSVSHEPLTP
jgi:hypothetical protein